jgi:hypothetical protein
LLSSFIICQQDSVKQITNFSFDCRNVAFFVNAYNYFYEDPGDQAIIFEGGNDTSSAIYELRYSDAADSFINPVQISKFALNRNPSALYIYISGTDKKYRLVLWESYNGNDWDIVASSDSGTGWSEPYAILNSEEDEKDFALDCYPYWGSNQLIYTKRNSVYLYSLANGTTDTLFTGNDTVSYSGGNFSSGGNYIAAAEMRVNGMAPQIVYKTRGESALNWGDTRVFDPEKITQNPVFMPSWGIKYLFYEILNGEKIQTKWITTDDINKPYYSEFLHEDTTIECSAFTSFIYPMPVFKSKDFYSFWPYAFRFKRNDSTFIRVNTQYPHPAPYNLTDNYYTKVKDAKPVPGLVGISDEYDMQVYTIWEDSSNGRKNLFGVKNLFFPSSVKNNSVLSFNLFQNYPNPFNPVTKIKYSVKNRENVTLKVYDILGKEVATLINEEKPAGDYEVTFNGNALASGVYIYRMTSGEFSSSKKLLLLK